MIAIVSPMGHTVEARALLDQGSELSFVTEALVQTLRLPRHHSAIPLLGIGVQAHSTIQAHSLMFQNRCDPSVQYKIEAHVLRKLSGKIPSRSVALGDCPLIDGLNLADPSFHSPGYVDILLGADIYGQLLREEVRRKPPSSLVAQSTTLGWILSGPVSNSTSAGGGLPSPSLFTTVTEDLNELVQDFWVQETVPSPRGGRLSKDEEFCETLFRSTHSRDEEGRYTVRLPFQAEPNNLGESRPAAERMLKCMQRRFQRDATLKDLYVGFLGEYAQLGHMRLLEHPSETAFYLPHHGVLRESSVTTKLRVVFNGSQKTSTGQSINDFLHAGPKLQQELIDVLMRWRRWPYVFAADVEKMFRQINVHTDDRKFQCILWERDSTKEPATYELATVTYGLTCAPYLVILVLHQLAHDERVRFPLASEVVFRDVYVDDVLSGENSVDAAQEKVRQVDQLFAAGGFKLQKWITNLQFTLSPIGEERRLQTEKTFEDRSVLKALGLKWCSSCDEFIFNFNEEIVVSDHETKRSVLSLIAGLFDPLGWLAPVVILTKCFLQTLWTTNLQWDDPLPEPLKSRWQALTTELRCAVSFFIPRWLGTSESTLLEIHGFSDASQAALAAVLYVRIVDISRFGRTSLLLAKTKVAPLKLVTIARLELSAAVLLAQLAVRVRESLDFEGVPVHLWTDSSVALTWIRGHPSRWKEFVGNRVAFIQENVPDASWHHVMGTENPADLASRGVFPRQLREQDIWWRDPAWLQQPSTSSPSSFPALADDINLEERPPLVHVATAAPELWCLLDGEASMKKLLRVTARVMEAAARFSGSREKSSNWEKFTILTPDRPNQALCFWVHHVQEAYFAHEIALLRRGDGVPRSSGLARLTHFLGEDGLMRLGGRLQQSSFDADCKHPIILPRCSPLTTVVIRDAHHRSLHGGVQLTLSTLRQKFWVIGWRAPVKSFILRCVT